MGTTWDINDISDQDYNNPKQSSLDDSNGSDESDIFGDYNPIKSDLTPKIKGHRRLHSTPDSNRDMMFGDDIFSLSIPNIPESKGHARHRRLKSTPEAHRDPFLDAVFSVGIPEAKEVMYGNEKKQHPLLKDKDNP